MDQLFDLRTEAIKRNISERSKEARDKLFNGMKEVPVNKILEQAQYLSEIALPKIKEKRGIDSSDYKFYRNLVDTLLWSILTIGRNEHLSSMLNNMKLREDFLTERNALLQKELDKYTTAEDIILSDSLDIYSKSIVERAKELNKKIK